MQKKEINMCPITKKVVRTFRRCVTTKPVYGDMHLVCGDQGILRVEGKAVTYKKGEAMLAIQTLINLLKGK